MRDHQLADMRLKTIGFVFQSFNLIPALTVEENVAWPLEFSGYSRGEVRQRVAEALEWVGVTGAERRHPAELSGGEQQRVAIARAIATKPQIVLADEPTGNLDTNTGTAMHELLFRLNQTRGTTFLVVTHSQDLAHKMPRVVHMRDGRIESDLRNGRSA
jgi:predicted ABC-type transport system involved in lysophospholipase L1 biosynthesis ATPase subunit